MFIFVPIIEIALFMQVGSVLGMWPTIGLVLITAFVGASLVRSQGVQTLMQVQAKLQQGELPTQQIVEGIMLAVSGVLLLTPGFMTDALGLLVLLPAPRSYLAKQLMSRVKINSIGANQGSFHAGFGGGFEQNGPFQQGNPFEPPGNNAQQGDVFEGEFQRKEDDPNKTLK